MFDQLIVNLCRESAQRQFPVLLTMVHVLFTHVFATQSYYVVNLGEGECIFLPLYFSRFLKRKSVLNWVFSTCGRGWLDLSLFRSMGGKWVILAHLIVSDKCVFSTQGWKEAVYDSIQATNE